MLGCFSALSSNAFCMFFLCGLLPAVTHSRISVVFDFHRKFHILWFKMAVAVVVVLDVDVDVKYLLMHKSHEHST